MAQREWIARNLGGPRESKVESGRKKRPHPSRGELQLASRERKEGREGAGVAGGTSGTKNPPSQEGGYRGVEVRCGPEGTALDRGHDISCPYKEKQEPGVPVKATGTPRRN